jgi:transposase
MNIKRVGIDLAKDVFQAHSLDSQEKVILRKQFRRVQVFTYFEKIATLPDWYGSLR